MNRLTIITITTFGLFLCGCTRYWYNPEKSYTECKKDFTQCRIECGRYIEDDAGLDEHSIKYEKKCMKEKGYRLVSDDFLPLETRRRPPDIVYKEKYGIAGSINIESEPGTVDVDVEDSSPSKLEVEQ